MVNRDVYELFADAAHWFADLVGQIPADAWSRPGLGLWDVRALTGHASRALITVDTYLDRPATEVQVPNPEDYYLQVLAPKLAGATTDAQAVAERGRQAGQALGDDPAAFVRALVDRVLEHLSTSDPTTDPTSDPVIDTIAGGMRLSDYLPTRIFELVVHGYDLAAAVPLEPPSLADEVLAHAVGLAGRLAVRHGHGPEVLSALTGRGPLTAGFTVV